MRNGCLNDLLRERGMTQGKLAMAIQSSRAHVCQVLANKPGRGGQTRKKLAPLLTLEELEMLGWDVIGRLLKSNPQPPLKGYDGAFGRMVYIEPQFVPRGTKGPTGPKRPKGLKGQK